MRDLIAVEQLRSAMKDPSSFKISQALRMGDGTLCLIYRATNSFNATIPGEAVITEKTLVTSDDESHFASSWNSHCAHKSGKDIKDYLEWNQNIGALAAHGQ
jgi:hypothetical protein